MPRSLRIKQILALLGYTLFFLVVPILIVGEKYAIFEPTTKDTVRITGGLIITAFIVYFFCKNLIKKGIAALAPGALRVALYAIYKALPFGALYLLLLFSKDAIDNLMFCTQWIFFSLLIAFIVEGVYDNIAQEIKEIKLMRRQDGYRERYNL